MSTSIRTANCALVRYEGGHLYVDRADGHSRREVYVELKGVRDRDHAHAVATEILQHHEEHRESLSIQGSVQTAAQIPTSGYALGDKMDGKVIVSLDVTSNELGVARVIPTLGDPYAIWEEAMNRRIARWASGSVSEWGAPVTSSQTQGTGTDTTPPEFSLSGAVTTTLSPAWTVPRPFQVSWLSAGLRVPGASATRVRLYTTDTNGSTTTVGTATIAPGDDKVVVTIDRCFPAKWKLILGCDLAGTGAQDLTASLRGAMV